LLDRLEQSLERATGHKTLAGALDPVAAAVAETRAAVAYLDTAPDEIALLQSRRLAELLADTAQGAFLLEEAAWSLEHSGDARKAAVARRFATHRLAPTPGRGITEPDRSVIDLFEPLVRYGEVDESDLAA
jgi:hypothetical protein